MELKEKNIKTKEQLKEEIDNLEKEIENYENRLENVNHEEENLFNNNKFIKFITKIISAIIISILIFAFSFSQTLIVVLFGTLGLYTLNQMYNVLKFLILYTKKQNELEKTREELEECITLKKEELNNVLSLKHELPKEQERINLEKQLDDLMKQKINNCIPIKTLEKEELLDELENNNVLARKKEK